MLFSGEKPNGPGFFWAREIGKDKLLVVFVTEDGMCSEVDTRFLRQKSFWMPKTNPENLEWGPEYKPE